MTKNGDFSVRIFSNKVTISGASLFKPRKSTILALALISPSLSTKPEGTALLKKNLIISEFMLHPQYYEGTRSDGL
ncbi:hypothetical protein [Arsenophonus nasoniae]|nr:hypothetical protein [Arsenophonus nasoniae]